MPIPKQALREIHPRAAADTRRWFRRRNDPSNKGFMNRVQIPPPCSGRRLLPKRPNNLNERLVDQRNDLVVGVRLEVGEVFRLLDKLLRIVAPVGLRYGSMQKSGDAAVLRDVSSQDARRSSRRRNPTRTPAAPNVSDWKEDSGTVPATASRVTASMTTPGSPSSRILGRRREMDPSNGW